MNDTITFEFNRIKINASYEDIIKTKLTNQLLKVKAKQKEVIQLQKETNELINLLGHIEKHQTIFKNDTIIKHPANIYTQNKQ